MEHGDLIRDAYASFVKRKENAIIEKLVELFNDGTLELLVNERIVNDINKITIGGGVGIRIPKLIDAQARIASLEAQLNFAVGGEYNLIPILKAQLEKAENALKFYANSNNWVGYETLMDYSKCNQRVAFRDCGPLFDGDNVKYGGKKAREYFAEKEQK